MSCHAPPPPPSPPLPSPAQFTCYKNNCVSCFGSDRRRLSGFDPDLLASCEARQYQKIQDCKDDCVAPPSPLKPPSSPPGVFACIDYKCEDCKGYEDRRRLGDVYSFAEGTYVNPKCNADDTRVIAFFSGKHACEQTCKSPPSSPKPPPPPPLPSPRPSAPARFVCYQHNCVACDNKDDRRRLAYSSASELDKLCYPDDLGGSLDGVHYSYKDCSDECISPSSPPPPPKAPPSPPTYFACVDDSCVKCEDHDDRRRLSLVSPAVALACETSRFDDINDCKRTCIASPKPSPPPSPHPPPPDFPDRYVCGQTACYRCLKCEEDDRRRRLLAAKTDTIENHRKLHADGSKALRSDSWEVPDDDHPAPSDDDHARWENM